MQDPIHSAADSFFLDELFRQADSIVKSLFRQRRNSEEEVQDCQQITQIILWNKRSHLAVLPSEERTAYSVTCARRVAIRWLKDLNQRQKKIVSTEDIGGERSLDLIRSPQKAAEEPDLDYLLSCLKDRDVALIDLYYKDGLTDGEVASILGITASAAKMRRRRVLEKIRELIYAQEDH